ncbi:SUMO-activating enzyme subunit 2, partial [Cymbomonas tetramitiformis]
MGVSKKEVAATVKDAKVLAIGAGGIGCELLKTLAVTGFQNVEVIDLDTIDISNLNRQFLFRKKHVGMPKSTVAVETVKKFRPDINMIAHYGNVKDSDFGVDYFRNFDVVLNGLDNLDARRHVNRLCLAAEVPLIESGTAGYLGQVTPHLHTEEKKTECFECQPKAPPKTFPICTIRNHPDRPIHCVVWAKEMLFPRLFGKADVTDLDEAEAAAEEGEDGELKPLADDISFFARREDESSVAYAERVFTRVFDTDIGRLLTMDALWKTRARPLPHSLAALVPDTITKCEAGASTGTSAAAALGLHDTHKVWSVAESAAVFVRAIVTFLETRGEEVGEAVFDKDDKLAVDFVTAAANLRAANFHIKEHSWFDIKVRHATRCTKPAGWCESVEGAGMEGRRAGMEGRRRQVADVRRRRLRAPGWRVGGDTWQMSGGGGEAPGWREPERQVADVRRRMRAPGWRAGETEVADVRRR